MKNSRQQKILEIIEKHDIDTQETLIAKLAEEGYIVTQTTVSRDIRQLNLVKGVTARGTYKYVSPAAHKSEKNTPVLNSSIADAIIKIEAACNIVVVKTYPGMANAVAVCIDSLHHDDIVGSVAGDDAILLVVKSTELALAFEAELKENFGKK